MLRGLVLTALLIDVGLIVVRVLTYPAVFTIPGFGETIGVLTVSLLAAAMFIVASIYAGGRLPGIASATVTGTIAGVILVAHMALENFGGHIGEDWRLTTIAMFTAFALWFSAGWRSGLNSTLVAGAFSGCWAALVSVILAVTFGFVEMFFDVPSSAYVAT